MKVIRKVEETINIGEKFRVGDQINIGNHYTATCQKISKKRAIFMFDQYLDDTHKMNEMNSNKVGYEESDLRKFLKEFSLNSIFDEIREIMVPFKNGDLLRIPTTEEIFGPEYSHKYYEKLNNKKQWPMMKDRKNRIAFCGKNQGIEWGWLQNRYLNSAGTYFALVYYSGYANYGNASDAYGVQPVFGLKIEEEKYENTR